MMKGRLTAGEGGETPINNSITLYEELKQRHPEFINGIERKVNNPT